METLSSRSEIDMKEVEKFYNANKEKALENASLEVSKLLEEIEFYRSHSFDEIERQLRVELKRESFGHIDEEYFQQRLDEKRKLDIFYDSMTKEQLDKFLHLYYLRKVKSHLLSYRMSAISDAAESLDKKEPERYDYWRAGMTGYAIIEPQDDYDKTKKRMIKEDLKKLGMSWAAVFGIAATLTTAGTAILGLIDGDILGNLEIAAAIIPFLLAAAIIDGSIITLFVTLRDKKVLKQSKEFGIYDLIIESLKSKKEFEDYIEELEAIADIELAIDDDGRKSIR